MKRSLIVLVSLCNFLIVTSKAEIVCELPSKVSGTEVPVISLNGTWEFCADNEAVKDWTDPSLRWTEIIVPGEPAMQGYTIVYDKWYAYRKTFQLAGDHASFTDIVRFNGVYSHAKVWVNGAYAGEHTGGFTSWDVILDPFVGRDGTAELIVAFRDESDEISFASGYAHHCIGGILRNVELITLPGTYISQLDVETLLDVDYKDAVLRVGIETSGESPGVIEFTLKDASGAPIKLRPGKTKAVPGIRQRVSFDIGDPEKWSDETPYLYEFSATLTVKGKERETVTKMVGFRSVERKGDKLCVNGNPVKLRGANRHDISPTLGRSVTDDIDLQDVLLAKEANINFIRTSHYPPSKKFLEYCDRYGIYVEEETAVCFVVDWYPTRLTQDGPAYTERYVSQLADMVRRDRSHPSVIIWSLGNESRWGTNIAKACEYLRKADTTRPVMFSYPGTVPSEITDAYDIFSIHYPDWKGYRLDMGTEVRNFSYHGYPVLADEWAPVPSPSLNIEALTTDPQVRDFWGISLDHIWSGWYGSESGLGGAIWCFIDETFFMRDTVVGYGEWGIADVWRRKKPEFFNTRKAYSPIRVLRTDLSDVYRSGNVEIPVLNRYNHILLDAVEARVDGRSVPLPPLKPGEKGTILVPEQFAAGKTGFDIIFTYGGLEVDREYITLRESPPPVLPSYRPLELTETGEQVILSNGGELTFMFNKGTGLLDSVLLEGNTVCGPGPSLTFITIEGPKNPAVNPHAMALDENISGWTKSTFSYQTTDDGYEFLTTGEAGRFPVKYDIRISSGGVMDINYTIVDNPPQAFEAGMYFDMPRTADRVSWKRNGYWSWYPEGHLGRIEGFADKYPVDARPQVYGAEPAQRWELDTKNF